MAKRLTTDTVVIHCAATKRDADIGAAEIDRWHRARGFFMNGYHVVIRRDGTVEDAASGAKCRRIGDVGAHAEGHNAKSVGVCLVGGLAEDGKRGENNFTPDQFASLLRVLSDLQDAYGPLKIVGHRDLPHVNKDCPSFDVAKWLATVSL